MTTNRAIEFLRGGKKFILRAKPFWTGHAFETGNGLTGVARVDARYANLRYHKRDYSAPADYTSGTAEEGYDGEYVMCMIDLTQSELDSIISSPGYSELPNPDFCASVETKRPRSNNPAKKVASAEERQRVYDDLQNEGHQG